MCEVHKMKLKGRHFRDVMRPHPMLQVRAFCQVVLTGRYAPKLLAGHRLQDEAAWRAAFRNFWEQYKQVDAACPALVDHADSLETCIPVLLHGAT